MNALEDDGRDSSAALSFKIGGHSSKPKSSTMRDVRASD